MATEIQKAGRERNPHVTRRFGIGDKEKDDIHQHGYFKRTDNNGQPCIPRARLEVHLKGQALPGSTMRDAALPNIPYIPLEDLAQLSFTHKPISNLFKFRKLKRVDSARTDLLQIGKLKGITQADEVLNKLVQNALGNAASRWKNG